MCTSGERGGGFDFRKSLEKVHKFVKKIFQTLEIPDFIYRSYRERFIAQKQFDEETLEVVFVKENLHNIVITCYFL